MSKRVFQFLYKRASEASDLPWHSDEPPEMLERIVAERDEPGRALDIGCGTGVYSVYLAKQGYEVTALDFVGKAVQMTRDRAASEGVEMSVEEADILTWRPDGTYEVILDSGCLHSLERSKRRIYAQTVPRWLSEGGDYALVHFLKRHPLDWRPIGPLRVRRADVKALFADTLHERQHKAETQRASFPIGPTVKVGSFWFSRI